MRGWSRGDFLAESICLVLAGRDGHSQEMPEEVAQLDAA